MLLADHQELEPEKLKKIPEEGSGKQLPYCFQENYT